jgi:hypothetical protein
MTWRMKWRTDFPYALQQGDFPGPYAKNFTAYPTNYPDTATQRGYPVGGYYDPGCISAIPGAMTIRMYRDQGAVHSCALIPKPAEGMLYGRYTERFRVTRATAGYKSAHLLWPHSGNQDTETFEVDYPESEWDTPINGFIHSGTLPQISVEPGAGWGLMHTTEIVWEPGSLSFTLDGAVIYTCTDTRYIPNVAMDWVIQNESALNGESAAPGSVAAIVLYHISVENWVD